MPPSIVLSEQSCVFSNLRPLVADHRSIHLGLLKVDRVPPHLILTVGEKYFSLEKDRCVANGDLPHLLRLLEKKGTWCVFVPLPLLPVVDAVQGANRAFHPFAATGGEVTCVRPIANFMGDVFGWGTDRAETVFDLLEIVSSNAKPDMLFRHGDNFVSVEIKRYTREDVRDYMQGL